MKNFFDCKDEKITEKAFSQSLIISVVSILMCLFALCSMTYAWFTSETSSAGNTLKSGCFDLTISVAQDNDETTNVNDTDITVIKSGTYTFKTTFKTVGKYKVELVPTTETTVKGYCVIKIGDEEYRTPAIVNDSTKSEEYPTPNAPFTFYITTTEPDTEVNFEIKWGAPSTPNFPENKVIVVEQKGNENEQ